MIKNKDKNYCPAPYRQIAVNPLGELSPCCMLNDTGEGFGKLTEEIGSSIETLKQGEKFQRFIKQMDAEQMPEVCERACGRQYPTEYHNHWRDAEYHDWVDKSHEIKLADIAFSNICNLTCTMCNAQFSSEWYKIQSRMDPLYIEKNPQYKPWNYSIEQVIELAEAVKDCNMIQLKGGEPFFNPRFKLFLKELADRNPNIHLPVLTNGTVIDDEALEQLSRFKKQPTYCVSLESTDNTIYQFIRGGEYTFDDIAKNIKYVKENYPKLAIKVNYVLGVLNIRTFKQDMHRLREIGVQDCNILLVHGPYEQSIKIVNAETRQEWLNNFKHELDAYPEFYHTIIRDGTSARLIEQMETLELALLSEDDFRPIIAKLNEHVIIRQYYQGIEFNAKTILDIVPYFLENIK